MRSTILTLLLAMACLAGLAHGQGSDVSARQQLLFAGLRAGNGTGQFTAIASDHRGSVYLLFDQQDGVRVLKVTDDGKTLLAETLLGALGDHGVAIAVDPAGNVYLTGTSTSGVLAATAGAAISAPTPASTNSFVAKLSPALATLFVSFTGGSRIAASAIAVSGDAIFVTGITYADDLPVTADAIQQSPAFESVQNGFVECFTADGSSLLYASYLTAAFGDVTPTAIAVDPSDDAWIVGSTTSTGFPTLAALIPETESTPAGFLLQLTPAGDGIVFSTFIPGAGLNSIALDSTGQTLLLSGTVDLGQFPVDIAMSPLAPTPYQVLLQIPIDGSTVNSATLIAPGLQSTVAAAPGSAAWIGGVLDPNADPLLQQHALSPFGEAFTARVLSSGAIDQMVRVGGLPVEDQTFAALHTPIAGLALAADTSLLIAGAAQLSSSASLVPTETYDLPLRANPTAALPSSIVDATPPKSCTSGLCQGSAGYLAAIGTSSRAAALASSTGDPPYITLRNLGSDTANGIALSASAGQVASTCSTTLLPGAECTVALQSGTSGTLTVTAIDAETISVPYPASPATASAIVVSPKELYFGIATAASAAPTRTVTITNLGSASETFSTYSTSPAPAVSEITSDCPLQSPGTRTLAAGASCHITLGLIPLPPDTRDSFVREGWRIAATEVLLTGYRQAADLSLSAASLQFGTYFVGGPALPRYLFLSNSSDRTLSHTTVNLQGESPFQATDTCPSQLAPQTICRIRFDYASPVSPSTDSISLKLDGDLELQLSGTTKPDPALDATSANPNLAITPTSIAFTDPVLVTGLSASTQTVSITNSGADDFDLSIALNGDFTTQTSCGTALGAGATCAVAIQFAPSRPGTRQGLLNVTAGAGSGAITVPLSGIATPLIDDSNGLLDFGSTLIGQPIVRFIKITRPFARLAVDTTGPYLVALVEEQGYGPADPPLSAYTQTLESPCLNCWIAVRFQSQASGVQSGTISLATDPRGNPEVVDLTGYSQAPTGVLLAPAVATFGASPVHSVSGAQTFIVTNLSPFGSAVTLAAPQLPPGFLLAQASDPNACATQLAYGSSCSITLQFAPQSEGIADGVLILTTSNGIAAATLEAVATPDPGLAVTPLSLSFAAGSAGALTQSVTLTNTSTTALLVGAPNIATAGFTATSNCSVLLPQATCAFTVAFVPAATPFTAQLTFAVQPNVSSDPSTIRLYSVALNGLYTQAAAALSVFPASAVFGPTVTGAAGSPQHFTVTNLTPSARALTLSLPRNFSLQQSTCDSVEPASTCAFDVLFVPMTNGSSPGTIAITGATADGPASVNLAYTEGFGVGAGALSLSDGLTSDGTFSFGQVPAGQSLAHIFTLTNQNTATGAPLHVRRVSSSPPFLAATTCGRELAPGATCTVTVTYASTGQAAASSAARLAAKTAAPAAGTAQDVGSILIESDDLASPETIHLTGQTTLAAATSTQTLATYTLSQGSLTFAPVSLGETSPAQAIQLVNSGNLPLHVNALTASLDFTVQTPCTTVAPGASCTIFVASSPHTAGPHREALELSTTAATTLDFISLTSTATSANLTLTPGSLPFGTVDVGTHANLALLATNSSTAPITLASLTLTGDYTASGTCSAGTTLAPQQSCTFDIRFAPLTPGPSNGSLTLLSSASSNPLIATFTGTGVAPTLNVTPASLSFAHVPLGATDTLPLIIANSGAASFTGLTTTATGDFTVSTPCATPAFAPGGTCTIQVTFAPAVTGSRSGTLTIAATTSAQPAPAPALVPLTGNGIAPPGFELTIDGPASVTLAAGNIASFPLLLAPTGGFTGAVALTCAPVQAAPYAVCSLTPSILNVTSATPLPVSAFISTGPSTTAARRPTTPNNFIFATIPLLLLARRRRSRQQTRPRIPGNLAILLLALTQLVACGGRGTPIPTTTPPGTYQFTVTARSTIDPTLTRTATLTLTVTAR